MTNIRNKELSQIHIAKKELGLDDETYRAMLWTCARVTSSKDLDFSGRIAVLKHMKARGWKNHAAPKVAREKVNITSKIHALLADMKLPWSYAEGIAKQMYKREKLEWCKPAELRGIVAALVNKQKKLADD